MQTLETHLSSLQQRVREAAEERAIFAERLAAEQAAVAEREHELRRVKQREYAEQQLRVEAEDRRTRSEHDSRAEIDRLTRRLGASEHHARELAERLESAQRELDEAEQAAAAEQMAVRPWRARVANTSLRAGAPRPGDPPRDRLRALRARAGRAPARGHARRLPADGAARRGAEGRRGPACELPTAREPRRSSPQRRLPDEQREELADALASCRRAAARACRGVAAQHGNPP